MLLRSCFPLLALLAGSLPLGACGDDADTIVVEGEGGTFVPADFPGWVPIVSASVAGESGAFLVDTGAPVTILDRDSFAGLEQDGARDVDLEGFGLGFPGYPAISYDIFGGVPGTGIPDGILGGDLLRHFALRLDYQGGRAALFYDTDPGPADTTIVDPGTVVSFDLIGGGNSYIPGNCPPEPFCGIVDLPATRILLQARFEGEAGLRWVLLDTGASAVVVSESFLAQLGDTQNRPRLDGVTITTATGLAVAALSRVSRLELEGTGERTGASIPIVVDDLPMLVLPTNELLQNISQEVDREVVALIGGTLLREFDTTIDFRNRGLRLDRYLAQTHVPEDEYLGVGFTLASSDSGSWLVADVYGGTDAQTEGLVRGQVVEEIGGTSITGLPDVSVDALFDGYAVGQDVAVGVLENGAIVTKQVQVEDLLPGYPPL